MYFQLGLVWLNLAQFVVKEIPVLVQEGFQSIDLRERVVSANFLPAEKDRFLVRLLKVTELVSGCSSLEQ